MSATTRQLIHQATSNLQQAGCDSPRLDAEVLLMHAACMSRTDLIIHARDQLPDNIQHAFLSLIERRARREPLAYICGEKEFWSRSFAVSPDVLIPRPETEHLIEAVLAAFPDRQAEHHFCDIGTGSGIIAITLACEYPQAQLLAIDISDAALHIARRNARRHQVADRICFQQGNMLQDIKPPRPGFDAIISNPPYVSREEMHALAQELFHEPRQALTDEGDGLRFLHEILATGHKHITAGGYIMLETGPCGLPATPEQLNFEHTITDLAGHARGGIYRLKSHSNRHG